MNHFLYKNVDKQIQTESSPATLEQQYVPQLSLLSATLCHQELVEQIHFLNFYVSHGSAMRFSRGGEKYYIYFVDNLLLFPTRKEFSKSVNT